MPPKKSWLWEHFHNTGILADKSHKYAICNYCANIKLAEVTEQAGKALERGESEVMPSKQELLATGTLLLLTSRKLFMSRQRETWQPG
jgi:hypothetical protein